MTLCPHQMAIGQPMSARPARPPIVPSVAVMAVLGIVKEGPLRGFWREGCGGVSDGPVGRGVKELLGSSSRGKGVIEGKESQRQAEWP